MWNWCLVLVLFLTASTQTTASQQDFYCSEPVDIALLLDSSSYFGVENFADLKAFVKNFINYFELKEKGLTPQIGLIPYSDKVLTNLVINFRYSRSSSWLKSKVDSLSFDGGRGSRLDLALRSTPSLLFRRIKGSRAWVPHVVLAIIGSAASWDRPLTEAIKREALALRTQGFQLMVAAIGLTDQTDRAALESMVASKDDLYIVRYSYGLAQVASKIMQQACPKPSTFACPSKVDLAFIVDSSGSISKQNYNEMKFFIFSIAKAMNVSETGAHVGVVIYSTSSKLAIKFSDHTNIVSFQKAVYNLNHMKALTRIDLGLKTAHTELFTSSGGARPGVKKMAFILTDGKQSTINGVKKSVGEAARPLIESGVKTFSIGIGSSVDGNELRAMVEDDDDVITAANFDELLTRIENITQLPCQEISKTECKHPADISFVLDSSSNVNYDEFEEVKRFVASMAKVFQISEYGSRCAVIVYGNQANLFVKLDASKNSRDFITSVDKLSRIGGRRRSFRGLELALDVLSNFNGGARRKVPKAVVVFTSGPESSGNDNAALMRVSKELRDQNILVFVVGIGPSLNTRVLTSLFQSSANLFPVTSFTELRDQSGPLTKQVCGKVGPGVCEGDVDVAFILDSSGSIEMEDFDGARNFIENLAKTFKIAPQKTHVGLMIYSDEAKIMSRFGKIMSHQDLRAELDSLPHLRGKTRIDLALKLASDQLFNRNEGMRSSSTVRKVAIVITDGRQSPAADAIRLDEAAAPLLVRGVKVLSIGIGDKVDEYELKMMVDNPEKHAFWAETYRALGVQLATIARESCSS